MSIRGNSSQNIKFTQIDSKFSSSVICLYLGVDDWTLTRGYVYSFALSNYDTVQAISMTALKVLMANALSKGVAMQACDARS